MARRIPGGDDKTPPGRERRPRSDAAEPRPADRQRRLGRHRAADAGRERFAHPRGARFRDHGGQGGSRRPRSPPLGPCGNFHRRCCRRRAPLREARRRGPDGLPLHRLQERPARDGRLVQVARRRLGPADHDLQQPDRLRRRRDAGGARRACRHAVDRLRQGGMRRHPPRHRHLQCAGRPFRASSAASTT